MEKIKVLDDLVEEYFEKFPQPTKSSLLVFLIDKQYKIAGDYEYKCHREDIIYELEDKEYDTDRIPNDLIDDMTDYFEDQLGDYGSENGWHNILNNVIDYFEEDLKEYKGSDE